MGESEVSDMFITVGKPLKRIYVREDTHKLLYELKKRFNFPSIDVEIRVLIHAFKIIPCLEMLERYSYDKEYNPERLERILKEYPCDVFGLGIIQKKEIKRGKGVQVVYQRVKDKNTLLKPIKTFIDLAQREGYREEIKRLLKEIFER